MDFINQNWRELTFIFMFLLLICICLLKYSHVDQNDFWFPKHLLPERKENSDYSEDVLIYDYDTKKSNIAYYDFKEEIWRTINYQDLPNNFKWRNLEIEFD